MFLTYSRSVNEQPIIECLLKLPVYTMINVQPYTTRNFLSTNMYVHLAKHRCVVNIRANLSESTPAFLFLQESKQKNPY